MGIKGLEKGLNVGENGGECGFITFLGKMFSRAYLCGSHLPNKGIFNSSLRFLGIIFVTLKQTHPK